MFWNILMLSNPNHRNLHYNHDDHLKKKPKYCPKNILLEPWHFEVSFKVIFCFVNAIISISSLPRSTVMTVTVISGTQLQKEKLLEISGRVVLKMFRNPQPVICVWNHVFACTRAGVCVHESTDSFLSVDPGVVMVFTGMLWNWIGCTTDWTSASSCSFITALFISSTCALQSCDVAPPVGHIIEPNIKSFSLIFWVH